MKSNILVSLRRFIKNKNTVTIIGLILILGLLFWGYNSTLNNSTSPIRVPVAKRTIQPTEEITNDMITYISLPKVAVPTNVKRGVSTIVGMHANVNTVIPAGSMFYSDVVIPKDKLPNSAFTKVKQGEIPYALSVTITSTYGNSIFPGNKIDVYMKATNEAGQVMVGRLLANVEVLAVKDSSGKNVFENTAEDRTPSTLLYGVPEDVYVLLKKAEYLKGLGVELFPVPYGGTPPTEGNLQVDRQELVEYINARTVNLPKSEISQPETPAQ